MAEGRGLCSGFYDLVGNLRLSHKRQASPALVSATGRI